MPIVIAAAPVSIVSYRLQELMNSVGGPRYPYELDIGPHDSPVRSADAY